MSCDVCCHLGVSLLILFEDTVYNYATYLKPEHVLGLALYAVDAIGRIENKLEMVQSDFAQQMETMRGRLEVMRRKQESMLTKQDQLQSTLHGYTSVYQFPSSSVFSGAVTPPLTSPATSIRAFSSLLPTMDTVMLYHF